MNARRTNLILRYSVGDVSDGASEVVRILGAARRLGGFAYWDEAIESMMEFPVNSRTSD